MTADWTVPRLQSHSEFVTLRNTRFHVRHWGRTDAPLVVLLHGWCDMSATYQFLVDACQADWHFVAPDWPGHGLSDTRSCYSIYDFTVDLHELLAHYAPSEPVPLVAHSMGGKVATLYAAAKPDRVQRLVNLEGYLEAPGDTTSAERLSRWIDSQSAPRPGSSYASREQLVQRLMKANPRLSQDQAVFLADTLGVNLEHDRVGLAFDPRASLVVPLVPFHAQITELCRQIKAPVLFVAGEDSFAWHLYRGQEQVLDEQLDSMPAARRFTLPEAGHNLHHDQPQQLAQAVEAFLTA